MINFSGTGENQHVTASTHKKTTSNETEQGSVEDPLNMHRTGSNEAALVSEIPYIPSIIFLIPKCHNGTRARERNSFNFKWWILWRATFPYFLPKGKFGFKVPPDISISTSWYFNQRLLNFN